MLMNATAGGAVAVSDRRAYRMASIDLLRGLVIVVMALDHVRDSVMLGFMQDPTAIHLPDPSVCHAMDHPLLRPDICLPGRG